MVVAKYISLALSYSNLTTYFLDIKWINIGVMNVKNPTKAPAAATTGTPLSYNS